MAGGQGGGPGSDVLLRAFGNLEGTVASMATQWREQELSAAAGRKHLYAKFEELLLKVNTLTNVVSNVQQDLAELQNDIETKIMPSIDTYNDNQAEKRGARKVGKGIWAGALALVTAASYGVHQLIQWFSGLGK